MKKMVVAVGVVAALAFAFSLAHAQFGGIKVPTSVQDVADAPGEMDYEYCKTLKSKYENNMDYNSGNIASRLGGEKNVSHSKDMKNWQRKTFGHEIVTVLKDLKGKNNR